MKIKLIQSGGIGGKKMTAEMQSKLTEDDWDRLIAQTKKSATKNSKARDAFHYTLQKESDEASKTVIDIQAIPEEHSEWFNQLIEKLKVEKK